MIEAARRRGADQRLRLGPTAATVLPGADFVVTCVGVGGRPGWQPDHEICQRHGIFQPVGDSVMPGGISRLLRTTPVLVEIARDVVELAPDAIFFNYSNPMTANVMAMAQLRGCRLGRRAVPRHAPRPAPPRRVHRQAVRGDLDAVRRHQPPDVHLRLPLARRRTRGRWSARRSTRELAEPPDPDEIGNIFADGTRAWNNPFSWEIFQPVRRVPRRRGPARHRVLPRAMARRQLLRQDARRRRVLGAGDPRVGRGPLPVDDRAGRRRGAARPEHLRPVQRRAGAADRDHPVGHHRQPRDVLLQRPQPRARCPGCPATPRSRFPAWRPRAASGRSPCPTCPRR